MAGITIRGPLDVPDGAPMAVSQRSTRELTTGDWRTFRPQYVERASPCNLDCPAGTDVRRFLAQAAAGDAAAAWRTILEHNPLPGVCGRVCYHPCEQACNRAALDGRVAVHAVERAVADEVRRLGSGAAVETPVTAARTGTEVAVVGAGPAGLSSAYHLARRGHQVTVYDEGDEPGGMLRYGIPAYRLPREVLDDEIGRLRAMGVSFVPAARLGDTVPWAALDAFAAIFVAGGIQRSRRARIEGEDVPGVRPALGFLREANTRGVPALEGRVVVIGGGNTAIDAARIARRAGATAVVVYRRSRADMPAHPDEIAQAEREGVEIVCHAAPLGVTTRAGHVGCVRCQPTRPGAPDASGRRAPEPIPGATFEITCSHVLTAIGEELDAGVFGSVVPVADGRIVADAMGRTSASAARAIFAGGDAATGAGTVVEAIGSGRRAAEGIDAWLRGATVDAPDGAERVGPAHLNLFHFRRAERVEAPHLPPARALAGVGEVVGPLAWNVAAREAGRCFACGECTHCNNCVVFCPDAAVHADPASGGYAIDLLHCKGCGVCVAECPRGAMALVPEMPR